MKRILFILVAVVLAAGVLAGCGGGGDDEGNPFRGSWNVPLYGVTVTIDDDTWTIPGIGSGEFSYEGDYPDYVVTLEFQGDRLSGNVHFNDEDEFVGCLQGDCATFSRI